MSRFVTGSSPRPAVILWRIHDLAQRPVIGYDAPLIERESVSFLEVLGPGNVLAGKMYPADGDER